MSKGCPCKSAAQTSASCAYCKGKKKNGEPDQSYPNYQGNEGYPDNQDYQGYPDNRGNQDNQGYPGQLGYQGYPPYQGYSPYQGTPAYENYPNYPNYDDTGADQYPYGTGNEYSDGDSKEPQNGDEPDGFKLNEASQSLLKAIAVFGTGCLLTVQMTGVANQL